MRKCREYFDFAATTSPPLHLIRVPLNDLRTRAASSGVSSHGQIGHQDLSSGLWAQQHGDKKDGQAHYGGDENRTRQADLVGGRV
jgi:hypothetical protein